MTETYPNLSGVNFESFVDGEGMRATIYLSGCSHNCPGCHNPQAHDPIAGVSLSLEDIQCIASEINKRPYLAGVALSGGDPFFDTDKTVNFLLALLKFIKNGNFTIWIYTGFCFEDILQIESRSARKLLSLTDVLVDGPFIQSLANKTLKFRGSSNQRIIDVQKTLEKGEIVIHSTQEETTA